MNARSLSRLLLPVFAELSSHQATIHRSLGICVRNQGSNSGLRSSDFGMPLGFGVGYPHGVGRSKANVTSLIRILSLTRVPGKRRCLVHCAGAVLRMDQHQPRPAFAWDSTLTQTRRDLKATWFSWRERSAATDDILERCSPGESRPGVANPWRPGPTTRSEVRAASIPDVQKTNRDGSARCVIRAGSSISAQIVVLKAVSGLGRSVKSLLSTLTKGFNL